MVLVNMLNTSHGGHLMEVCCKVCCEMGTKCCDFCARASRVGGLAVGANRYAALRRAFPGINGTMDARTFARPSSAFATGNHDDILSAPYRLERPGHCPVTDRLH